MPDHMNKQLAIIAIALSLCGTSVAQNRITGNGWEWNISDRGSAEALIFTGANAGDRDTVRFISASDRSRGQFAGPSFYLKEKQKPAVVATWTESGTGTYTATIQGVECRLKYRVDTPNPTLGVTLTNRGNTIIQPEKAGIKLGVDTYMDRYPEWFDKYFPTLMRNERDHFWGYLQNPRGKVLALVSSQPIASWSVDFNLGYQSPSQFWFWGHRIESLNLDLLNALPLPERHPQNLYQLVPGDSISWDIAFIDIKELDDLEYEVSKVAEAPILSIEKTTYRAGERAQFEIFSGDATPPQVTITNDKGEQITALVRRIDTGYYTIVPITLPSVGFYTIRTTAGGHSSEGVISVIHPWRWYMNQARRAATVHHQKATSHAESWYGFYSAFIAAEDSADAVYDAPLAARFELLFDMLHDTVKMEPRYYASRIQNTSTTIGMLVDKYEAYGDRNDLERAARLADWLIATWQRPDGAYVNHGIVYTSVIYVAKSILELAQAERLIATAESSGGNKPIPIISRADSRLWAERTERHYASAKRAIDQLVAADGNFETEGELTFEDGMISCSALQIGALALMQSDTAERSRYTQAMLKILNSHAPLAQLRVPDARRRGGTMRFWEAQYDVLMLPNMFNSPHGWSAWRGYATYYAYLLTGDERWLLETFNAMGTFANLIDAHSGKLSWAFVVDPYLNVDQAAEPDGRYTADSLSFDNPHPKLYKTREFTIGEQYIDMVSHWQGVNTQDNDVHEVFKLIGEAALHNAFVVERPSGEVVGYNCRVIRRGKTLIVIPSEPQFTNIHFNVPATRRVSIEFPDGPSIKNVEPMSWIRR